MDPKDQNLVDHQVQLQSQIDLQALPKSDSRAGSNQPSAEDDHGEIEKAFPNFEENSPFLNDAENSPESKDRSESAPAMPSGVLLSEKFTLRAAIESIIFASPKPIKPHEILEILQDQNLATKDVSYFIDELISFYNNHAGGFRLDYIKNEGYQFRTVTLAAGVMEKMFSKRPRPLSRAALETLAIIAYKQPLTRAEIEFIRGVDVGSALKNLMDRGIIACVGRKADAGRPLLFATADEFLKVYRLSSLKELPSLDSLQINPDTLKAAEDKIIGFQGGEVPDVEAIVAGDETLDTPISVETIEPNYLASESIDDPHEKHD